MSRQTPDPVGIAEIAERLGVDRRTADQWRTRKILPDPEPTTVGGRPWWRWEVIRAWADRTGRLRGHGPGRHTAELHGAVYKDYMPVGEIRCVDVDGTDRHVLIGRAFPAESAMWRATPVERTDNGTGPSWNSSGPSYCFRSEEAAIQWAGDYYRGVSRFGYGPADLGHEGRMPDLTAGETEHLRNGGSVVVRSLRGERLETVFEP